ncbi:M-phase phosphoprotein 6 [Aphelenchoides avenae]|nr:M-phase phosphoprotein 6 [Aphelenchus avenae]
MKRAAAAEIVTKRVSSNVLQMQFMKRSRVMADVTQQEKKDEKKPLERNRVTSTAQKIEDPPVIDLDGTVYETRFPLIQELRYGRFSFKGQNPEIEKLAKVLENRRLGVEEEEEGEVVEIEQKPGPAQAAASSSFARGGFYNQRQEEMRPLQISGMDEQTGSLDAAHGTSHSGKPYAAGNKRKHGHQNGGQQYGRGGGGGYAKRGRAS